MAYGLETMGGIVGGMLGGAGGALQGAGQEIPKGIAAGGALGAATGAVLGVEGGPPGMVVGAGALGVPGAAIGGTIYGGVGAVKGAISGVPGGVAKGQEIGRRWSDWITQMSVAERRAKRQAKVTTELDKACATCGCTQLANGVSGTPYRGGAHAFMQTGGGAIQSHHTPPQSVSPLLPDIAPAIQMDRLDHYSTQSFGRPATAANQLLQKAMIDSGNFMGAVALDAADIRAKFPGKYDGALLQMMVYAQCLKDAGIVK